MIGLLIGFVLVVLAAVWGPSYTYIIDNIEDEDSIIWVSSNYKISWMVTRFLPAHAIIYE